MILFFCFVLLSSLNCCGVCNAGTVSGSVEIELPNGNFLASVRVTADSSWYVRVDRVACLQCDCQNVTYCYDLLLSSKIIIISIIILMFI